MTVKLFGINSLKVYYEAPYKSDVIRWTTKSFENPSDYTASSSRILPEPMMIYDDHKNYIQTDISSYAEAYEPAIKVRMVKPDELGHLVQRKFSNKRKAASFLHISVGTLEACKGQKVKDWEILEVD
jgi:hypothetical protein